LCEWIRIPAEWLEPVYNAMLRRLLAGDYVQADDVARQRGEGFAAGVTP
jgi:hypothetical protein